MGQEAAADTQARPLLVVMCGLPASGKSTLAKKLENRARDCGVRVACIHFDDWLLDGDASGAARDGFDPAAWKVSRTRCMEEADTALGEYSMVILDDTMHYTSMRIQCWKLARARGALYCQVYVDCPIERCLARNSKRDENIRIPDEVMERMGLIFEAPREHSMNKKDGRCSWDALTVLTSASRDVWGDIHSCKELAPPLTSESELDPVIRTLTTETITHQVDIQSRRLMGEYIGQLNPVEKRCTRDLAKVLNSKRRDVLSACRETLKTDSTTSTIDPLPVVEHWLSEFRSMCESLLH